MSRFHYYGPLGLVVLALAATLVATSPAASAAVQAMWPMLWVWLQTGLALFLVVTSGAFLLASIVMWAMAASELVRKPGASVLGGGERWFVAIGLTFWLAVLVAVLHGSVFFGEGSKPLGSQTLSWSLVGSTLAIMAACLGVPVLWLVLPGWAGRVADFVTGTIKGIRSHHSSA